MINLGVPLLSALEVNRDLKFIKHIVNLSISDSISELMRAYITNPIWDGVWVTQLLEWRATRD